MRHIMAMIVVAVISCAAFGERCRLDIEWEDSSGKHPFWIETKDGLIYMNEGDNEPMTAERIAEIIGRPENLPELTVALTALRAATTEYFNVNPDKLDYYSVWTNSLGEIEIFGYEKAAQGISSEDKLAEMPIPFIYKSKKGNHALQWWRLFDFFSNDFRVDDDSGLLKINVGSAESTSLVTAVPGGEGKDASIAKKKVNPYDFVFDNDNGFSIKSGTTPNGNFADLATNDQFVGRNDYQVMLWNTKDKSDGSVRVPLGTIVCGTKKEGGSITNDEVSIAKVGGTGDDKDKYQIARFKDGDGCQENLSEMLTTPGMGELRDAHKILARYSQTPGDPPSVHWVSLGDGIYTNADDGASIDTNADGDRQINGFEFAERPGFGVNDFTILGIGAPSSYAEKKAVSWKSYSSVLSGMLSGAFYLDSDNKLKHSTMPGGDGQYAAQAGDNDTITWSKIEIPQIPPIGDYMKADEHSLHREDIVGNTNLCIKGANNSVNKDKILFCGGKDADNNWQKIEDVVKSMNGIATAYGDTSATVGIDGWNAPSCDFDIAGLLTGEDDAERQKHRILSRYVDGDIMKMHYPKIGKLYLPKTDEVSITTNATKGAVADGKASMAGYADAEPDTVPHRKAGGGIEWRIPSAVPTAVKIVGTEGAEIIGGGASATNVIRFASATDSNVRVNVSKENDEVIVTIGVYWKE